MDILIKLWLWQVGYVHATLLFDVSIAKVLKYLYKKFGDISTTRKNSLFCLVELIMPNVTCFMTILHHFRLDYYRITPGITSG